MSEGQGTTLRPHGIQSLLETDSVGRRIYYLTTVDSTNRLARELARQGERDGTVVVTDYQTAGRGRRERSWISPPGKNLLFSLILRPPRPASEVLAFTLGFSLAIAERLGDRLGVDVGVKWPNDVVTPSGKLCGILAEASIQSSGPSWVIVGIGVNVNMLQGELPVTDAVSCLSLSGMRHDRAVLFADLLGALERMYGVLTTSGFGAVRDRYKSRLSILGKEISIAERGRKRQGKVIDVRNDGGLVVREAGRGERTLYDGEVSVR